MSQTIKCPNCKEEIELSEALTHQLGDEILKVERRKFESDLKEAQEKAGATQYKKAQSEFEQELKQLKEASAEEQERSKRLVEQVTELTKELRSARRDKQEAQLEMEKKLAREETKIRADAEKKALEAEGLKTKEKDKVITDLQQALADATRKAKQGSQQTQGEVLELEIEEILRREFPSDTITEVKKGVRGADVIQVVTDKWGRNCGTILWESKNAQWQNSWIAKLKSDTREAKAHLSVLVATNPPEDVLTYSYIDGVWVVTRKMISSLANVLRFSLVKLHHERMNNVGKDEKKENLFQYVTSHEFRARIEASSEFFTSMQSELEREKRWFNSKWARQEKQLRVAIDNTYGTYADMQGVVGKAMLQLPSLEEGDNE